MTGMLYETHIRKNMNNFRWFLHNLTLKYLLLLLVWANWADSTALTIPSQAKLQVRSLPIWIQSMPWLGWQWDSIPLCSAWPEVCHDMPRSYRDTKGRCDDILPTFEWSNLRLSNVLRKSWKVSVRIVTSSYFIIRLSCYMLTMFALRVLLAIRSWTRARRDPGTMGWQGLGWDWRICTNMSARDCLDSSSINA